MATRRQVLCGAFAALAAGPALAQHASRRIEFHNINTRETLRVTFHDGQEFVPDAVAKLQHLMRDFRTGEEHEIDTRLYLLLTDLAAQAGREPIYDLISGYRSPKTNGTLRAQGHGVAEHSQHMEGRAMDVRLHDFPLDAFRDLALAAKRGGVGYYRRSNWVHVDTGRVRQWSE
jgi:uncharacterized protein YcbK (DUF882 family)